ncbi:MAG: hypothetical protein K2N66_05935, partial [Paramuribaculum sp.]|nr:hypothetical protein [Paramuribaculum sp.]
MLLRTLIAATALTAAAGVYADSPVDIFNDSLKSSHRIILLPGNEKPAPADSMRAIIDNFYFDQFRNFQDPAAPYFLFMSRDANLAMGIGGCVRMRGWYDWGGAIPANGFAPALIPMTPDPTQMRRFATTPAGTSLFFKVLGHTFADIDYQIYIECNFNGGGGTSGGHDFHLKKAYAIINDWTVGYASSTFSDPAAQPPTVDAQGPNNKMAMTDVLLRWMKPLSRHFTLALSAENPAQQTEQLTDLTAKVDEWLPDFAAFIQYGWRKSEHVRLAAIYRTLSYRNLAEGANRNVGGVGLQLSSISRPLDPLTVYATVTAGKGTASLGGDMLIGNFDLVPDPEREGVLYAPWSLGWCGGLQWNFKPELFVSATVSQSRYLPSYTPADDTYRYGTYIAANVFWNPTPRVQVGAE